MAEKSLSSSLSIDDKIRLRKRTEHRSPIQCSTIPEGEIYHSNVRRTSLSIPCQSSRSPSRSSTTNSFQYSRKKFQSFYRSLIPSKSSSNETTKKPFEQSNRKETIKIPFPFSSSTITTNSRKSYRERNYRYSLPDTSTRTFILKNLRQKNGKISLKNSSNDETVRSTFQNLLSLVKFPSNKSNSTVSTNPSTTSSNHIKWNFHIERSEWFSSGGIGRIRLSSIELHNLTMIEIEHLQKQICDKFERSTLDINVPFHLLKDEPIRKRKHHFMFRSKSTDKSKETKESKSSGNVFGIALSECVQDEQENRSDDQNKIFIKKDENLSDSNPLKTNKDQFLSPSISSSSINDSGFSLSPTSPTSLKICDVGEDYQEKKYRSISLEALGIEDLSSRISRSNTLRCYPPKVPELIRICCHYLENYGLQTVGLFRVGVSKKRLKELKDQINLNRTLTFDSSTNVHDIAGLMKEFLRELPEPLLTRHLSIPFLQIRRKIPPEEQNEVLADLIRLLPSSNRDTLYQLLKFLHHVSLNCQDRYSSDGKLISIGNKMDTENLSIVFAPTILLDNKITKDSSITINAEQIEHGKDILKLMIENYKDLFMIEKNLHDQICYSICQIDDQQLNRLLAFKIQNRCGISTMELDDENDEYLRSIDSKCLSMNEISIDTGIISSSSTETFQRKDSTMRRYNLRRNSDFPSSSSSSHSSRSSEYLQVPLSKSHQRLTNPSDQQQLSTNSSSRIRDIREARMDQIIFRLIHPEFPSTTNLSKDESSNEITSSNLSTSTSAAAAPVPTTQVTTTTTTFPLLRELKSYCRSKTAPLALSISGKFSSTGKTSEAKDLCGTSSNDSTN